MHPRRWLRGRSVRTLLILGLVAAAWCAAYGLILYVIFSRILW